MALLGRTIAEVQRSGQLLDRVVDIERYEHVRHALARQTGIELVLSDDDVVRAEMFYGGGFEGYETFQGELPWGLAFALSQAEVRNRLGTPSSSGVRARVPVLGEIPPWDRFDARDELLHVEYDFDAERIRRVTLAQRDFTLHGLARWGQID